MRNDNTCAWSKNYLKSMGFHYKNITNYNQAQIYDIESKKLGNEQETGSFSLQTQKENSIIIFKQEIDNSKSINSIKHTCTQDSLAKIGQPYVRPKQQEEDKAPNSSLLQKLTDFWNNQPSWAKALAIIGGVVLAITGVTLAYKLNHARHFLIRSLKIPITNPLQSFSIHWQKLGMRLLS